MKNRTYRYYTGTVQYPFGFGLSYTSFSYAWKQPLKNSYTQNDSLSFSLSVNNTGAMDGDEVIQAYIQYPQTDRMPIRELKAFKRVTVARNGSQEVHFSIPIRELQKWDLAKAQWQVYNGTYSLVLGSNSRDRKLIGQFQVAGNNPSRKH